jgi:uncharacterized repeat protein (TIGR01451 family)
MKAQQSKKTLSFVLTLLISISVPGLSTLLPQKAMATAGVWSGAWTPVTQGGVPVTDEEARGSCKDFSNGLGGGSTSVSPEWVDIASEADCTGGPASQINPGVAPSMYYVYEQIGGPTTTCLEASDDFMEVRTRVGGEPRESGLTDFKGSVWFSWFDTTGDGVADYYARLNGANGDTLDLLDASFNVLWSQAAPLTTGYANVVATPEVPSGDDTQAQFYIDVQFPISGFGVNVICPNTPLTFAQSSTSEELNEPTAKDLGIEGVGDPIPHGDPDDADVDVVKDVDDTSPAVGDTVTFTITVTNSGPEVATSVVVSDLLPTGVTFDSAIASQGSYNDVTGVWTVGTLAVSGSATLTIDATVDTGTEGDTITNTACVTSLDQVDPDQIDCDDAVLTVDDPQVDESDIQVEKTASTAGPLVGATFTYTLTATNNGPDDATGVTVEDLMPTGVTYQSDNGAGAYNPVTGIWTVGDLANGASETLDITVTVNNGTANQQISNTACVETSSPADPNTTNDCDTVVVTVVPVVIQQPQAQSADLEVTKTVSNPTPNEGDTIVFIVSVLNVGPNIANNVTISDIMPTGLTFVSSTGTGSYSAATGVWTIGTLGVPNTASLTVTATVNAGTAGQRLTNTAAIRSSDQPDPDATDNSASASVTIPAVAGTQQPEPTEPTAELVETGAGTALPLITGSLLMVSFFTLRRRRGLSAADKMLAIDYLKVSR